MSWKSVETARRCFARFGVRDLEGFLELMDPDVEVVPAIAVVAPDDLMYGTYRGHDGVRQWFTDLERWTEYRVETEEFQHTADGALVTAKVFFVDDRQSYLYDVYFVFSIREGKVLSVRTYADKAEALGAAGLSDQDAHSDA